MALLSTPGPQPSTGLEAADDLCTFVAEAQFQTDSLDELVPVGGVATLSMAMLVNTGIFCTKIITERYNVTC